MWFKHWPNWPDRTGTSTLTATTVDPYDDEHRIVNYTSSYIDPDVDPAGHAAATIGNNITQTGSAGMIFPHSLNPLRTFGSQIKFKGVGFSPRRFNNREGPSQGEQRSVDATINYYTQHVNNAPTLGGASPLDVNLYNSGYTHHLRLGWNLVITYKHYYGAIIDNDSISSFPQLVSTYNTLANSGGNGVYFVGEDGKYRLQDLEFNQAFYEFLDPNWLTLDPAHQRLLWKGDLIVQRFVGTPPSVEECPIAKVISIGELERYFDRFNNTNDTTQAAAIKRDLTSSGRKAWARNQLSAYAAGQNGLTCRLSPGGTHITASGMTGERDIYPACYIFSGDSGTPYFASTHQGEALLGIASLFGGGAAGNTDLTTAPNVTTYHSSFFDDVVSFSQTTEGAHMLGSDGTIGMTFVDPIGGPNTVPSITGPIKPKRTEAVGRVPGTSTIETGEIATNLADGKIYSKKNDGTVVLLGNTPVLAADVSGLGTAAVEDIGTSANDVVQLDGSGRLPAVDGSQLTNLPAATSMPASGLTSGSISIDLIPDGDLTREIGSSDYRWAEIHGNLDGAVHFRAKNDAGRALSVGEIVYISGSTGADTPDVGLARSSDSARMPAFGMISTGGNDQAEVYVTTLGSVTGVNLPSATYTVGDEIYVHSVPGQFTNTVPTGESKLIQKIGKVTKVNDGAGSNGVVKIMGAGRTNATPNLDQDKVFLGNASNQAASTALSAINLSKFNNDLVLSSTDYVSHPVDTSWKFFCDFFQVTPDLGSNDGNNQFWMMGGGSGVSPQDQVSASARGQAQHTLGGNNRRYCYWGAMILNDDNRADGDELLWESRVYFTDSTATTGTLALGVVDRVNTLNRNDAPPNGGYSSFDYAALSFNLAETNARIVDKDTGTAGNATGVQQLTAMTNFVDTWFRIGVHCKFNNTNSNWDIDFYIDGTKVGSTVSMTFDESIVPYVGISVGTHTGNCGLNIDWISYQGNIGQAISGRTTALDIGSL